MKKKVIRILLLFLMLPILAGCGSDKIRTKEKSTEFVIGVVGKSKTSEYWMSVYSGMEDAAKNMRAKLLFFAPELENDNESQTKLIRTLIKDKVDVLAISPVDAGGSPEYLKEAKEAGIPVISFDSGFEDASIPYIGIDNEKAGFAMAKFMTEKMNHKGEIIVITGELSQMCHKERLAGINRYMKDEKDIKIVHVESGYSGLKMSGEKLRELFETYPHAKGIIVTSAVTALGIIEGTFCENLKIVTIDVQEDAIDVLKKRKIIGLVAQSGYDIGYETIEYAKKIKSNVKQESRVILDAKLLTNENLEEYLEKYSK